MILRLYTSSHLPLTQVYSFELASQLLKSRCGQVVLTADWQDSAYQRVHLQKAQRRPSHYWHRQAGFGALSEGTVRQHPSLAIQKLGARNRMEAARLAEQKGWL